MKKISDEEFLKKQGWEKKKGWKIDLEMIRDLPDSWDYCFTDDITEYAEECEFWSDGDERAYDDVDTLLEKFFEEFLDEQGDLWDEPVQDLDTHKPEVNSCKEVSSHSSQG